MAVVVTRSVRRLASETLIEDSLPRRLAFESDGDRSVALALKLIEEVSKGFPASADARLGSTVSISKLGIEGLVRHMNSNDATVTAKIWSDFLVPVLLPAAAAPNRSASPAITSIAACATGLYSWIRAAMLLEEDEADAVIAGAAEATLSDFVVAGFRRMGVISSSRPRPFDRRRDGFVPAEGAALVLLEREEDASARGASVLGRIAGRSMLSADGDVFSGAVSSRGIAALASRALASAGREKREISYVHLHGTGTIKNDEAEAGFLREFFEADGIVVPASSTKALTGHCLGAAGAIESLIALDALSTGIAPPNFGMGEICESCRCECLIDRPTALSGRLGLVLSYGFGGPMAALLLEGVEREGGE